MPKRRTANWLAVAACLVAICARAESELRVACSSSSCLKQFAADLFGNVYAVGELSSYLAGDIEVVKFESSGRQAWSTRYNSPENGIENVKDVVVDRSGAIYVTGRTRFLDLSSEVGFTVKFGQDGRILWTARHGGGPETYRKQSKSIAVDDFGFAYVTGEYHVIKYSQEGTELWHARTDTTVAPVGLVLDPHRNVFVAGNGSGGGFATVKLNQRGELEWIARYRGSPINCRNVRDLIADRKGNVYVTGNEGNDSVTIKYGPDGAELWTVRAIKQPAPFWAQGYALAVDDRDDLYLLGTCGSSPTEGNLFVAKYGPDGRQKWSIVQPWDSLLIVDWHRSELRFDRLGNCWPSFSPEKRLFRFDRDGIAGLQALAVEILGTTDVFPDGDGNLWISGGSTSPQTSKCSIFRLSKEQLVALPQVGHRLATMGSVGSTSPRIGGLLTSSDGDSAHLSDRGVPASKEPTSVFDSSGLAAPRFQGDGFRATLRVNEIGNYSIEASSDLRNWVAVTNLVNVHGTLDFSEPAHASFPVRFYRAVRVR